MGILSKIRTKKDMVKKLYLIEIVIFLSFCLKLGHIMTKGDMKSHLLTKR